MIIVEHGRCILRIYVQQRWSLLNMVAAYFVSTFSNDDYCWIWFLHTSYLRSATMIIVEHGRCILRIYVQQRWSLLNMVAAYFVSTFSNDDYCWAWTLQFVTIYACLWVFDSSYDECQLKYLTFTRMSNSLTHTSHYESVSGSKCLKVSQYDSWMCIYFQTRVGLKKWVKQTQMFLSIKEVVRKCMIIATTSI